MPREMSRGTKESSRARFSRGVPGTGAAWRGGRWGSGAAGFGGVAACPSFRATGCQKYYCTDVRVCRYYRASEYVPTGTRVRSTMSFNLLHIAMSQKSQVFFIWSVPAGNLRPENSAAAAGIETHTCTGRLVGDASSTVQLYCTSTLP
jgi:hypothetical protein